MCILCGQLLTHVHWADRRSLEGDGDRRITAGGPEGRQRRRERNQRVRLLKILLGYYGLSIDQWSGMSYLLSNRKGKSTMIDDLGALWPAAEELAGRRLDPLDPGFLEALERQVQETTG